MNSFQDRFLRVPERACLRVLTHLTSPPQAELEQVDEGNGNEKCVDDPVEPSLGVAPFPSKQEPKGNEAEEAIDEDSTEHDRAFERGAARPADPSPDCLMWATRRRFSFRRSPGQASRSLRLQGVTGLGHPRNNRTEYFARLPLDCRPGRVQGATQKAPSQRHDGRTIDFRTCSFRLFACSSRSASPSSSLWSSSAWERFPTER